MQVLETANATMPNLIGVESKTLQSSLIGVESKTLQHSHRNGYAHRVGLLWEAWANFSMRDFPSIRYIDISVATTTRAAVYST